MNILSKKLYDSHQFLKTSKLKTYHHCLTQAEYNFLAQELKGVRQ